MGVGVVGGSGWVGESGGLVMCLFDRCQTGIIERGARQVRHGRMGRGVEWRVKVRAKSKLFGARRERRMESARGRAIDQRRSARAHATVSVFVFLCVANLCGGEEDGLPIWLC